MDSPQLLLATLGAHTKYDIVGSAAGDFAHGCGRENDDHDAR